MDDRPVHPLVFANHVIHQLVEHMVGEDVVIEPEDYTVLRVVFRKCGGQWHEITQGNLVHLELLKKIVSAWGRMPQRIREGDRLI